MTIGEKYRLEQIYCREWVLFVQDEASELPSSFWEPETSLLTKVQKCSTMRLFPYVFL